MKKRILKKHHVRDVAALGFRVEGHLVEGLDDADADRLLVGWIEFIESRSLVCGGGLGARDSKPRYLRFYCERSPKTCTDADRDATLAWLRSRPEVAKAAPGELRDVY